MPGCSRASLFLLVLLAGCTLTSKGPPPDAVFIPGEEATTSVVSTNLPISTPTNTSEEVRIPDVVRPMVVPPVNPVIEPAGWVSLEQWCEINGFGSPRRLPGEAPPQYAFSSSIGTMVVRIGSEQAFWNGLEYRLGFAPQVVFGKPSVRDLDARKNLGPILVEANFLKNCHTIVIDPGHGGADVGASNIYTGHFEKEYTLDLAKRLQTLLIAHGWTVWLTRSNDVSVPLSARVALAEQLHGDLFISLHFNSALPDRQQVGVETYCLTPTGMPSSLTREFADNVNLTYPNNRFDEQNLELAVHLHRALLTANGHADRGVRKARFLTVLQGQNRPAVLIEGGYLSNPREGRQIAEPSYRQKLAEALAQSLGGEQAARTDLAGQVPIAAPLTNLAGKIN